MTNLGPSRHHPSRFMWSACRITDHLWKFGAKYPGERTTKSLEVLGPPFLIYRLVYGHGLYDHGL